MSSRLSLRGLAKAFGANTVLHGFDLDLAPGEIHALVGGNGAGKSTLAKIVAGILEQDAGAMLLDGESYRPASRRAAQAAGVVMVLQESSVLPTLTVAENLFLGALPTHFGWVVDRSRLHDAAAAALARVGLAALDPEIPAGLLGVGQQQLVEIAAGLALECRLLILDEPTAALTGAEVETLFGLLRRLCGTGATILYISHRLDEVAALADRVSVLRDGRLVATLPARATERNQLIELMAGAPGSPSTIQPGRSSSGSPVLRVRDLRAGRAVCGVSLDVHRGEIVGLGGLVGAGRTELLRALFGADRIDGGTIWLGEDPTPFAPAGTHQAVERGLALVPENRRQHGLFAPLSVQANATIALLPRRRAIPGWIDSSAEANESGALRSRLGVRCESVSQPIEQLSGGNQQKIVIGRWLRRDVRLWLLDEPTRGVDAVARREIYGLLRARAAAGEAMLVASSDYEELGTLCDRVIVLSKGRVAAEFPRELLTPAAFTHAAFSEVPATVTN